MSELFEALTRLVQAAPFFALSAAFAWGVLSILLSPCHLAGIPLLVGYIAGQDHVTFRRSLVMSLLFAAGILLTIGLIGLITASAGRLVGDVGALPNYLVAGVFLAVGLHLLGVITIPFQGPSIAGTERRGLTGALLLGLILGLGLGPCTFAYMAPVLGVAFKTGSQSVTYGTMLLLSFGLGHCSVFVVAGSSLALVQRYVTWDQRSGTSLIIRRLLGVLILLAGIYLIYASP